MLLNNQKLHTSSHLTLEAIYPGCDRALVGEVARDPALVPSRRPSDEGRVEDEAVLRGVTLRLQSPATDKQRVEWYTIGQIQQQHQSR